MLPEAQPPETTKVAARTKSKVTLKYKTEYRVRSWAAHEESLGPSRATPRNNAGRPDSGFGRLFTTKAGTQSSQVTNPTNQAHDD